MNKRGTSAHNSKGDADGARPKQSGRQSLGSKQKRDERKLLEHNTAWPSKLLKPFSAADFGFVHNSNAHPSFRDFAHGHTFEDVDPLFLAIHLVHQLEASDAAPCPQVALGSGDLEESKGWVDCVLTAYDHLVCWRNLPQRKYIELGTFPLLHKDALDVNIVGAPFPHPNDDFVTPMPRGPSPTPRSLANQLMQHIPNFEACWKPATFARLNEVNNAIGYYITYAHVAPSSHRLRARQGSAKGELRFSLRDRTVQARAVVERGLLIAIEDVGNASLADMTLKAGVEDWGINARALRREGLRMNWKDLELEMFDFEAYDYSPHSPPIRTLSAHCPDTMSDCVELIAQFNKELSAGWFTKAQKLKRGNNE